MLFFALKLVAILQDLKYILIRAVFHSRQVIKFYSYISSSCSKVLRLFPKHTQEGLNATIQCLYITLHLSILDLDFSSLSTPRTRSQHQTSIFTRALMLPSVGEQILGQMDLLSETAIMQRNMLRTLKSVKAAWSYKRLRCNPFS